MQRTPSVTRFLGATTLCAIAALAAASGASCSQETRDFEDPTGTSTGQGGSGGTSSSSGQGGNPTGGGSGGGTPGVCTPDLPQYAGPLCGPPSMPCGLRADEVLPSPPSFRNDAPSVAVDGVCAPHVAYSVAEGGFFGFYAHLDAQGAWVEEPTPFGFATVSLAAAPDSTVFALADDGAYGVTLWNRTGGQWLGGTAIPGQSLSWSSGMARDSSGVLHAAVSGSDYKLRYGRYDNGWTMSALNEDTSTRTPIALSPSGEAHIAYWDSNMSGWQLTWIAPPLAAEIAAPLGSNGLSSPGQRHAIAVTPPDGQNPAGRPHILFARPIPGATGRQEIAYATRQGAGAWNVFVIDQETSQTTFCGPPPMVPGLMCNFDYEEVWPIGVVASQGGDVRFVYEKIHFKGTSVSECPVPGQFCYWVPQSDESTGQVLVAWLDGNQQAGTAVVADAIMAVGGTVALDALGTIHLAAYDAFPPGQDGTTVRYLQIGP